MLVPGIFQQKGKWLGVEGNHPEPVKLQRFYMSGGWSIQPAMDYVELIPVLSNASGTRSVSEGRQ